jgi:hypothetical protein
MTSSTVSAAGSAPASSAVSAAATECPKKALAITALANNFIINSPNYL